MEYKKLAEAITPEVLPDKAFEHHVLICQELFYEGTTECPADSQQEAWNEALKRIAKAQAVTPIAKTRGKLRARARGEAVTPEEVFEPLVEPAISTVVSIMTTSDRDSVRLDAAKEIMSRALGKPKERQEHEVNFKIQFLEKIKQLELLGIGSSHPPPKTVLDNPDHPLHAFIKEHPPEQTIVGRKSKDGSGTKV